MSENMFAPNLNEEYIDNAIASFIMPNDNPERHTDPYSSTETYAFRVVAEMARKGYTFAIACRPTDSELIGQKPMYSIAFWKNGYNESGTVRCPCAARGICLAAMSAENLLQAHEYADPALDHIEFQLPNYRAAAKLVR